MLQFDREAQPAAGPQTEPAQVVLSYLQRTRARLRVVLEDGRDAALFQPRGRIWRHQDHVVSLDGRCQLRIVAAPEAVYRVQARAGSQDPAFDLLRGAYHLGNRHIPLMLSPGHLVLERDPVLRELLDGLGLDVRETEEAFDPEPGAYGGGHRHDHDAFGGSLGEQLSREAHAARAVPDLGGLVFRPS